MLKLSKLNETKKWKDENEYVESEDDSDFETDIHFSDNEFVQRTGLLCTSVNILLLRAFYFTMLMFAILSIFRIMLNSKQIVLEKKSKL